jgi:hypothetical protein
MGRTVNNVMMAALTWYSPATQMGRPNEFLILASDLNNAKNKVIALPEFTIQSQMV